MAISKISLCNYLSFQSLHKRLVITEIRKIIVVFSENDFYCEFLQIFLHSQLRKFRAFLLNRNCSSRRGDNYLLFSFIIYCLG